MAGTFSGHYHYIYMNPTHTPQEIEKHPWEPFIPANARILIMGTFPPKPVRWSMDFYYPNKINDFWRIMGLIFHDSKDFFIDPATGLFQLPAIKDMLEDKGIALNDTGAEVRRLKDNASDKFLEIIRPVDLKTLLEKMPHCHAVATTGEKAAGVIATLTDTPMPKMGQCLSCLFHGHTLNIYRMPSTSRAYPMALDKKAEFYAGMFRAEGIL